MRVSQYLLSTLKESPIDAEIISHQLMLRAGMIRKLASGLYSWLPTGLRVLHKLEKIIREEMNNICAIELFMPIVQPADLWQKSGRWVQYGPELLRFSDRNARSFILSPTHEEAITNLIKKEICSYKQLPLIFYQIQTKFRDELRPYFGVIRSREFIMKDAYSFHINQKSLQKTYDAMYEVYINIFNRIGLEFIIEQAETGLIGGSMSHEFRILNKSTKNNSDLSVTSSHKVNFKLAKEDTTATNKNIISNEKMHLVDTSNIGNIKELMMQFELPIKKIVKTILVRACEGSDYPLIALIMRGDHQLDYMKAEKLSQVAVPLTLANEEEIFLTIGVESHSIGPVNLPLPIIIDYSVSKMSNFVAGANIKGKHFFSINWERDLPLPQLADLRKMANDHVNSNNKKLLQINHGIEVGHIFQLGMKYSESMKATVYNKYGINQTLIMGCYGIGITRLVAAAIEQKHDKHGIIWPESIAPFNVVILPINMHKCFHIRNIAENIYQQLHKQNIDVLLDDRKENPGKMFADMELIGIPHQLIIGDRNLKNQEIEYKNRISNSRHIIKINDVVNFLIKKINHVK